MSRLGVDVSELGNEELAELMYEITEEVEARLKYGSRATEQGENDNTQLPF